MKNHTTIMKLQKYNFFSKRSQDFEQQRSDSFPTTIESSRHSQINIFHRKVAQRNSTSDHFDNINYFALAYTRQCSRRNKFGLPNRTINMILDRVSKDHSEINSHPKLLRLKVVQSFNHSPSNMKIDKIEDGLLRLCFTQLS